MAAFHFSPPPKIYSIILSSLFCEHTPAPPYLVSSFNSCRRQPHSARFFNLRSLHRRRSRSQPRRPTS
nr:hypothetical protein Iba_chr01dCG13280 [Ipomoea batatas]GMC55983.1 hypothetical protein Iba_chr01fCG2830 [Ipomoea batatas]GMC60780.1 hypothetical protein Iba_scaffold31770CG0070 [Ipomoea batatas]GMD39362.1 hypothetical protein Iba_scaffold99579CG0010 [Ipomoea batatas]